MLGICRGMQLINVALGGTLVQHLPEHLGHGEHRRVLGSFEGAEHDVGLLAGSLAARAAGEVAHTTRSHHHQGVDRLGEGLTVSGFSTLDELPEAIELSDRRFVLGVQWHPEADPESEVIGAFVEAAGAPPLPPRTTVRLPSPGATPTGASPPRPARRSPAPEQGRPARGPAGRTSCGHILPAQCGCRGR